MKDEEVLNKSFHLESNEPVELVRNTALVEITELKHDHLNLDVKQISSENQSLKL